MVSAEAFQGLVMRDLSERGHGGLGAARSGLAQSNALPAKSSQRAIIFCSQHCLASDSDLTLPRRA